METTIAIMIYLSILFTGEEYHKDYVYDQADKYENEIEAIKEDDEKMSTIEEDYIPRVDDITVYKYDEDGHIVIIDPREMN